ncbi:MAG: SMI1/KNR4 family protein [Myxococcota bacterium]
MSSQKRTAIERAAKRLGVTFPEPLINQLETFELHSVGGGWSLTLPPAWQLLSEIVHDDFDQVWNGPAGVVIGENLGGDLVCLIEEGREIKESVHLLDHATMTLKKIADNLEAFRDVEGAPEETYDDDDDEPRPEDDYPPLSDDESMGLAAALGKLLGGDELPPEPEPEPLNPALVASIEKVLDALILQELLELSPDRRRALVEELAASTGEARTPKALLRRFVRCLVESDHPEEVYGTDTDIEAAIRKAWS